MSTGYSYPVLGYPAYAANPQQLQQQQQQQQYVNLLTAGAVTSPATTTTNLPLTHNHHHQLIHGLNTPAGIAAGGQVASAAGTSGSLYGTSAAAAGGAAAVILPGSYSVLGSPTVVGVPRFGGGVEGVELEVPEDKEEYIKELVKEREAVEASNVSNLSKSHVLRLLNQGIWSYLIYYIKSLCNIRWENLYKYKYCLFYYLDPLTLLNYKIMICCKSQDLAVELNIAWDVNKK